MAPFIKSIIIFMILQSNVNSGQCFLDSIKNAAYGLGETIVEFGKETYEKCSDTISTIIDAALDEDCEFTCPAGTKRMKNTSHHPIPDGCGSFGLSLDSSMLPLEAMTKCCDQHDICYSECFANRDICDSKFKRCLYSLCENHREVFTSDKYKRCKAGAKLLYLGTLALGCKSYQNAQKDACICQESNKYKKKHWEL